MTFPPILYFHAYADFITNYKVIIIQMYRLFLQVISIAHITIT